MIKELIKDIAFDNIKLSQALTRAKLIENKIKNVTFKQWLVKELEGYEFVDVSLPAYRKVWSVINLTAEFPYQPAQTFAVLPPDDFAPEIIETINFHKIIEPIQIVEQQIESIDIKGYLNVPMQMVVMLGRLYKSQLARNGGVITGGSREIGKVHYQNVLEQTKQKLLDTLMELDNEFPNLVNEFVMNKENEEKVQNIITNHVYGAYSSTNVAAGVNVNQTISFENLKPEDESKLKSYGISEEEINELKTIIQNDSKEKTKFVGKAMKWLGSVTASVAGRGLYENIPAITDFVHKLTS
jgi:hypothetical protein